jgi:hypothetical protein
MKFEGRAQGGAPSLLDSDKGYQDVRSRKFAHSPAPSSSKALEILRCRCLEPIGTDLLTPIF